MSDTFPKVEVITGVARRRRFPTDLKLAIVAETMQPGMSTSYVARQHGLSPSLVFRWRRLMSHGGKEAEPLRNICLIGTEAIDPADHIAVARPRGEDVPSTACLPGISLRCWRAFRSSEGKRARGPENPSQSAHPRTGLDGFWIHRVLLSEGIESQVVGAASIAALRRRRRAKTDRIDGQTLLRALLAHKRGEPRVCSMVRAPTPEDEDRRGICRERKVLIMERVQHDSRIDGLLFSQGASGYELLRPGRGRSR